MAIRIYQQLLDKLIDWLTREPPPAEIPPCDFNRLKYEIRPADVLLIEGQSRISKIIRNITQSPWTHSALYIGRLHEIEDPHLRKLVATHMKKRENVRLVIEGVFGYGIVVSPLSSYRHHHIRICRPYGLSPADAELVIAYAIKALGKPYNMRQLLDLARFLLPWSILPKRWGSSLFRTPTGEPESGICSSLIAEAFNSVKFPVLPYVQTDAATHPTFVQRNPHLYTPKDFDYSPYFEIIKYPNAAESIPYYRRLPWVEEGTYYQDHGVVSHPDKVKKKKNLLPNLLSRTKDTAEETNPSTSEKSDTPSDDASGKGTQ